MIPIKDKKYMLNCQGPYDYNVYMGEGIYTGANEEYDNEEVIYGFKIPNSDCVKYFLGEEIVAEFVGDNLLKESEQTDIANAENRQRGLTLTTLCNMVLGENASDRSDEALINGVRQVLILVDQLASSKKAWETELSKVMPSDYKDWWENSKEEWPMIARLTIESLRKREQAAWVNPTENELMICRSYEKTIQQLRKINKQQKADLLALASMVERKVSEVLSNDENDF